MTHYQTLNVKPSATVEEIRQAYRREALRLHPDRNPGDKDAESQFKELSAAYTVLTDSVKRQQYDLKIQPPRVSAGPRPGSQVPLFRRVRVAGQRIFPDNSTGTPMYGSIPVMVDGVPMQGFRSFKFHPMKPDNKGGNQ